jgi:hypothetical protein
MRFTADGPDIPGDLLDARDDGQVIFFCGSGVSLHQAGGPTFPQLAQRVITELGVPSESTAAQVLGMAQNLPAIAGVGSVIATDQIFGLLERDFPVQDVRRAVSKAVKPPETAVFDAHRSLLDLSRGPDGITRLVTTNFDLLFEAAASTPLDCLVPPLFPNPSKGTGFRGIVHLHGKVNDAYDDIDSEEFVLSSADFGRAYLSDGWATRFMQALIERFRIVFVGYSADDPPLKYLLEALRPNYAGDRLYAFQNGAAKAASALWMHKGVTAIPFDHFDQLWSTITLWAERARDPETWHNSIATLASQPPGSLKPFERGQIAHLVSSQAGARTFLAAKPTPSAQWLGVFDPAIRYSTPRDRLTNPKGTAIDPFAQFGLDSDLLPSPSNPQNPRSDRALPDGAWSAFEPLPTDTYPNSAIPRSSMRGGSAQDPHQLSSRQFILSNWLGRVADQPFAIWWAAEQHHLHPALSEAIERTFETPTADATLRQTWRDLIDAKRKNNLRYGGDDLAAYGVVSSATASGGWSEWHMQRLFETTTPRMGVRRAWTDVPVDPTATIDNLIAWEVRYPTYPEVDIPDEWLRRYVEGLRNNLTLAVALETRLRREPYFMLRPFEPINGDDEPNFGINHASDFAHRLVDALRRLIAHDPQAAFAEAKLLPPPLSPIFSQLHIWAAGQSNLSTAREAAALFRKLDAELLWDSDLERDLLIAIKARWNDLTDLDRTAVAKRFLKGRPAWEGVNRRDFRRYRTAGTLNRLYWLQREGLATTAGIDVGAEITRLRKVLSDWTPEDAEAELERERHRSGWVQIDTDATNLLTLPPSEILAAIAAGGTRAGPLIERKPLKGLMEARPVRTLSALKFAERRGEAVASSWSDILWDDARANDAPHVRLLIALRLAAMPEGLLVPNLQSAGFWLKQRGQALWRAYPEAYFKLWGRLATTVAAHPDAAGSGILSDGEPDWVTSAINSVAGRLTELLFEELEWADARPATRIGWLERAGQLLTLPADQVAFVIPILTMRLAYLYYWVPDWTEEHVLAKLEGNPDASLTRSARAGFLGYGNVNRQLFARLRPLLLSLMAEDSAPPRGYRRIVGILLSAWRQHDDGGNRLLSSEDLRTALMTASDADRVMALNQLLRWHEDATADPPAPNPLADKLAFLEEVWPRQSFVRSGGAMSALAQIALTGGEHVSILTEAILPLLTMVANAAPLGLWWMHSQDETVAANPDEYLAVISAILPLRAGEWPYGVQQLVEKLASIAALKGDPRLVELQRRIAGI